MTCPPGTCNHDDDVNRHASGPGPSFAPPIVHEVLRKGGSPMPPNVRRDMEDRLGHNFADVRIHTDTQSADSASAVAADAYTVRNHVVFGAGRFAPDTAPGRKLLLHELAHTSRATVPGDVDTTSRELRISSPSDREETEADRSATAALQGDQPTRAPGSATTVAGVADLHRQATDFGPSVSDADLAAEREYADSGAPKAASCGRPSWCPAGFCSPYSSEKLAEYYRAKNAGWLLMGISAAVDSRVVPLWREYLDGGSSPKNLTKEFGKDFTKSPTTVATTSFLVGQLHKNLASKPPKVSAKASIDIATLIPGALAELGDPTSKNRMNFNIPKDVPGNIAGDIGTNQTACKAGAKPSPFNDERVARGTVELSRVSGSTVEVRPVISYQVRDTIDLCPGDCGTRLEQIATVPLSQFEATGISGDVPFTVEFPAPPVNPFTITAP